MWVGAAQDVRSVTPFLLEAEAVVWRMVELEPEHEVDLEEQ